MRGILSFVPSMAMWGLNVERFLPPAIAITGWITMAQGVVMAHPRLAQRWGPPGDADTRPFPGSRLVTLMIVAGAALMVGALGDNTWFTGDFAMRQSAATSGSFAANFTGSLPIEYLIHYVVLRQLALHASLDPFLVARVIGALEAGAFAALVIALIRALDVRGRTAIAMFAVVFFGGYLTMFTGLAKPARELALVSLAILTFGISLARSGKGLMALAVSVSVALLLHRSAALMLPAALVALWLHLRRRDRPFPRTAPEWIAMLLPVVTAFAIAPRVIGLFRSFDLPHHLLAPGTRTEGVLATAFSALHLLDLANLFLVYSPAFLLLPALLFLERDARREAPAQVIGAMCLTYLPVVLFVHPQQGIFRDWDVFVPAGVAGAVLTGYLLSRTLERAPGGGALAVAVAMSVVTPSAYWLMHFHDAQRGLARVRAFIAEPPSRPTGVVAWTWDFLGTRYYRLGDWDHAAQAQAEAARYAPHRRVLLLWAAAETMRDDHRAAQQIYRRMLAQDPNDPLGWLGLGGASIRLRDSLESARALKRLEELGRDKAAVATMQRHLQFFPQVWPQELMRAAPARSDTGS